MAVVKFRGLSRRFIPEMLRLGLTANAGLNLLRSEGMGYRRTDFLADWREAAGLERKRDPLQSIPKKLRPTADTIQPTEYIQRQKFNYTYKITGYDVVLQKDVETYITVASDDLIRMEEAELEAERLADKYKVDIDIAKMVIDGVTVRKE